MDDNPFPARHGPGLLPAVRDRLGHAVTIKDVDAEPGGLCVAECPSGAIAMEPEQA